MIYQDYAKKIEKNLLNEARNKNINELFLDLNCEEKLINKKVKYCATRIKKIKWLGEK